MKKNFGALSRGLQLNEYGIWLDKSKICFKNVQHLVLRCICQKRFVICLHLVLEFAVKFEIIVRFEAVNTEIAMQQHNSYAAS